VDAERAEFVLVTLWESEATVRAFAGPDVGRAVFYPEDERFLIEKGERVAHYEVVSGPEGERPSIAGAFSGPSVP
jgi:heme-degrading monooxygenase HmoA